ncbi:MAG: alpha/beta hydrolase fold domain-containing protein [Pirellulaceae bacterium]
MRSTLRVALVFVCVAVAVSAGAGWCLLVDESPPAERKDLSALPEDAPPAPGGYPTESALKLAFVLGRLELVDIKGPELPPSIEERKDIEYGRVGARALLADLYSPKEFGQPVPGLIFIHGGGWKGGNRADYRVYTIDFAKRGYVVATISYRFAQDAKFPAAVEDAKCAVRWMRANATQLHVDPERIAVLGGSAGGYLSLMVGYTAGNQRLEGLGGHAGVSSAVQAVVDLYGPTDLDTPLGRASDLVSNFLGKSYADDPELYRFASPITHLDAEDPPTFVLQGTIDTTVPVEQSDLLVAQLKLLGVPHWYDRLDGWPHTMDLSRPVNDRCQLLITKFLETYLRP